MESRQLKCLRVDVEPRTNLGVITLTRPKRLNSFIDEQYAELRDGLRQLGADERVRVVLLTAVGSYYSSGHDLSGQAKGMMRIQQEGLDLETELTKRSRENAQDLVSVMIDFEKPIVAAVNGPALGIAVTTLALCDVIFASSTATFQTPFMRFGFCAEGCSSVLFPRIMGQTVANEMLLMGRKLTAPEAKDVGFISEVLDVDDFMNQVRVRVEPMASFPAQALRDTKRLVRDPVRKELHEVNEREITTLIQRFLSAECAEAVMKFMMERKAKL